MSVVVIRNMTRALRVLVLVFVAVAVGHYAARRVMSITRGGDMPEPAYSSGAPNNGGIVGTQLGATGAVLSQETLTERLATAPADAVAAAIAAVLGTQVSDDIVPDADPTTGLTSPPSQKNRELISVKPTVHGTPPLLPKRPFTVVPRKGVVAKAEGDFEADFYFEDPRKFRICSLRHICLNSKTVFLPVVSDAAFTEANKMLASCSGGHAGRHDICLCFTKSTVPKVIRMDPAALAKAYGPEESGHTWLIDKYVGGHQIGHWSESLVFFHSLTLRYETYNLPPISRLILQKSDAPMSDHEAFIYDNAVAGLPSAPAAPLFQSDLEHPMPARCFAHVSTTSVTAKVASERNEANVFRTRAYDALGIKPQTCPPPAVTLLFRTEGRARRTLNEAEILAGLSTRHGLRNVTAITINDGTTSEQQVRLFAETGLLLSSHSSQLINMLFSQRGAAVIEMVPVFFNNDFLQLADSMDVHYQFALGGTVPGIAKGPEVAALIDSITSGCRGEPGLCVQRKIWAFEKDAKTFEKFEQYGRDVKHLNFMADMASIDAAVGAAITYLHSLCGGHWPGAAAPAKSA